MKQNLINIHNKLIEIETKGQSTCLMADCIREMEQLIFSLPDDTPQEVEAEPVEEVSNES